MTESYLNLNNVWTPVLCAPNDTVVSDNIIVNGDIWYHVEFLKASGNNNIYIIRSKSYVVLPESAKMQISNLQTATTVLGQQMVNLALKQPFSGWKTAYDQCWATFDQMKQAVSDSLLTPDQFKTITGQDYTA